jgi:isopentenyl-diphosphate delta-isomerase type 1
MPQELLPVVDRQDRVTGFKPRQEVHARGLLHRAVHVLVYDRRGRLYLQLRSPDKDTHPGKWTSSASGHLDPGEDYWQAARRELLEELGLNLDLEQAAYLAAGPETDQEFVTVYRALTRAEPRPEPAEISEGRWFAVAEARQLAADPARSAPSLHAVLEAVHGGPPAGPDAP